MTDFINITVKLFGPAAEAAGASELTYSLARPARLNDLLMMMYARYPGLAARASSLRFAINEEYIEKDTELQEADEVAVIPPVAGGAPPLVELTAEPIDPTEIGRRVQGPTCGAVVTFQGSVRASTRTICDRTDSLAALECSAYESMAARQLERIRGEAGERFAVDQIAIVHRLGRLAIGDIITVVAVSAAHRAEAFEACAWVMDTMKLDVPIFKRELWSESEPTWVDPTPQAAG